VPFDKAFIIISISPDIKKTSKKSLHLVVFYFGKEKSSSIFAPTFAKAKCVAKPKGNRYKQLKVLE